MKIAILGGTGAVGSCVVLEALHRGHDVLAVVRCPSRAGRLPGPVQVRVADALDTAALAAVLRDQDVAISALRPSQGREPELVTMTRSVLDAGAAADVRLVLVGGAATLRFSDDPDNTVLSKPGFLPEAVRPIAAACAAQRALVLERGAGAWTHLCPPPELAPGVRAGRYRVGGDVLLHGADGRSRISMEDFAVALVDEAETGALLGRSAAVAW